MYSLRPIQRGVLYSMHGYFCMRLLSAWIHPYLSVLQNATIHSITGRNYLMGGASGGDLKSKRRVLSKACQLFTVAPIERRMMNSSCGYAHCNRRGLLSGYPTVVCNNEVYYNTV